MPATRRRALPAARRAGCPTHRECERPDAPCAGRAHPPPPAPARVLVGRRPPGADARRLRRALAAVPRLPGAVRLQLRRADDGVRHLRLRAAGLAARRRRALRPRRAAGRCSSSPSCSRPRPWCCSWRPTASGWLLAARVVQGLATGALTSTLGAALLDLQRPDRPLGAFLNSASPGLGLSLGAVGAGLLVQFVPSPTDWVFGVLTVVFLLAAGRRAAAAGELAAPARRARLAAARGCTSRRAPPAPSSSRCRAWSRAWALGGLYASLGPSLVAERLRHRQPPRRRAADPRAQRHRHHRVAGRCGRPRRSGPCWSAPLIFTVGVAGTIVALFADSAAAALRRRRRHRLRLRRRLPGRHRDDHPRGRPRAPGRPARRRLRRRLPGVQPAGDRGRHRRRRDRPDPDDRDLRRARSSCSRCSAVAALLRAPPATAADGAGTRPPRRPRAAEAAAA